VIPALLLLLALALPDGSLNGRVLDGSHGAITQAHVIVSGAAARSQATTGVDGRFRVESLAPGTYDVTITAVGFRPWRQSLAVAGATEIEIVLEPAGVAERVTVTAARGDTSVIDTAAPASLVSADDLAHAPAPVLDDVLRITPGFSLFRRTSSRSANPTTQGATLRGLAASGASRALVLADGAPLNDPFGGWVYWNRVPYAAIDHVEIVRGGGSDLYGADALAGVVQVLTSRPATSAGRALVDVDTNATGRMSLFGATVARGWLVSAAGEASRTDGTFVVSKEERGSVDRPAGGDYVTGYLAATRHGDGGWRGRVAANAFGEDRENGTALQVNDTSLRGLRGELGGPAAGGWLEIAADAGDQTYHQTFSSIAASRASETLTSRQNVPVSQLAGAVTWRRLFGATDVLFGADVREIAALNVDTSYAPDGSVRSKTSTPGFQRSSGLFGQVRLAVGNRVTVIAGARGDVWQPVRGTDGAKTVVSPRASVAFRASSALTFRAAVGRSFRAPTLNERIRPFRVGNVLTLANAALRPETLVLIEGGAVVQLKDTSLRFTAFTSRLDDAVTNVTISSTPQLITRRRENAGAVRATGLEVEGQHPVVRTVWVTGTLAGTRSRFVDTPGLTGNHVPQVPTWQGAVGLRWQPMSGTTVQAQVRALGQQFEDDRNSLQLRRATLVDVSATRMLGRGTSLFAAVENLFDVDYDTGRTPTRTVGIPVTGHFGVRAAWR
jgi:outer membrane receptor protein involved in Fe transport